MILVRFCNLQDLSRVLKVSAWIACLVDHHRRNLTLLVSQVRCWKWCLDTSSSNDLRLSEAFDCSVSASYFLSSDLLVAIPDYESFRYSMKRFLNHFVFFTGICLIGTIGQAILLNDSYRSGLQYLLQGVRRDVCLDESTLKVKSECFLVQLETYYGMEFTMNCPYLPNILVARECQGYPWDRVGASAVNRGVTP